MSEPIWLCDPPEAHDKSDPFLLRRQYIMPWHGSRVQRSSIIKSATYVILTSHCDQFIIDYGSRQPEGREVDSITLEYLATLRTPFY